MVRGMMGVGKKEKEGKGQGGPFIVGIKPRHMKVTPARILIFLFTLAFNVCKMKRRFGMVNAHAV